MGLAIYVAIYDWWAIKHNNETMSAAFGRSMAHPVGRWVTFSLVVVLLKHLMFPTFLPQTDPLRLVADKWRDGVETIT